jgi:hypothetical protein
MKNLDFEDVLKIDTLDFNVVVKHYATNRNVVGSITDEVIFFKFT